MSLLESMMEPCVMLDRVSANDGVFGVTYVWTPGAKFGAAITKDTSIEARMAEKQGVNEVYTVITGKGFGLSFHDVFRRISDGSVFRVTSNQRDLEVPAMSSKQIGKVSAELWELPSGTAVS